MVRLAIILAGWTVLLLASDARAQAKTPEQEKIEALQMDVEKLKGEVERLKAELASIKEQVAGKSSGNPTATPPQPVPQSSALALGPADQKVGGYVFSAPTGWTAQPARDSKLGMMYRSPDKSGVILVQIKPKGAAPPEMQAKYGQQVTQMLRQDFVKNKTEVIEQPTAVKDDRFYLKVQEKIKVKPDKTATQMHVYRVEGKDMIELTSITTAEKPEDIAAAQKIAEDMVLGLTPEK
jgi:hypothetical protein